MPAKLKRLASLWKGIGDGTITFTRAGALTLATTLTAATVAVTTLTVTTITGTNITATGVITGATIRATDDVHVGDNFDVAGAADITGPLGVTGTVTTVADVVVGTVLTAATGTFTDDIAVTDNASIGGACDVTGPLGVTGTTTLSGTTALDGDTTFGAKAITRVQGVPATCTQGEILTSSVVEALYHCKTTDTWEIVGQQ